PLFQVLFVLQNAPVARLELPGAALEPVRVDHKTSKYDLSLFVHEAAGDLPAAFLYRTDLFNSDTVAGIRERFQRILEQVTENPDVKLSSLNASVPASKSSEIDPLSKLMGIRRRPTETAAR